MDRRLRKYMLYKAKEIDKSKSQLRSLIARRKDIIDSLGGFSMDGQPHGKGLAGKPTEQRAIRLLKIDKRIARLEEEIAVFEKFEKESTGLARQVYFETIKKDCIDLNAKADLLNISPKKLFKTRGKILKYLATELGELFEEE